MKPDNLVNQASLKDMPRKGSRQYCELVTKIQGGEPFIRRIMVNGRPYWQRCQWVYRNGKRRLKVIEHLGPRKPRAAGIKNPYTMKGFSHTVRELPRREAKINVCFKYGCK